MRKAVVLAWMLLAALPAAAGAQLPAPLGAPDFTLPGALNGPGSAASAALALSDRWLGDTPFDNPAVGGAAKLALTPTLQRMSRQDLRANNREFDEQPLFVDAAGGWIGVDLLGVGWTLYASQPLVRLEDHAFIRGRINSPDPPAVVEATTTAREFRAGIGAAIAQGPLKIGVAGEWTSRNDDYDLSEDSGSPDAGTYHADFSGSGVGFSAGLRFETGDGGPGSVIAGASARFLPELELDGEQVLELSSGDSQGPIAVVRESAWEGGASGRVVVTPGFHLTAGLGGRSEQAWDGFGLAAGSSFAWGLGGEMLDPEAPWVVRVGIGQEQHLGTPEPRAGVVGIGFGWKIESGSLDLGALRRSIERSGLPTSFDDRILGTYTLRF